MKISKTKQSLTSLLDSLRQERKRIVLVPTMGALHEGHASLIRQARSLGDVCVCSIFVNPTQFNDPEDLKKYPRPIRQDIALLESEDCDILFLPTVDEMYGTQEAWSIDLGVMDNILEGEHRPGHFQGVTQIVYKLFEAVKPDLAIFGQKDLQQFMVIQSMVAQKSLPVKLVMAPIVREPDGLAMSSRNIRLSPPGRQRALVIYETLLKAKAAFPAVVRGEITLDDLRQAAIRQLDSAEGLEPEYFAICDPHTLSELEGISGRTEAVALVAAWVDGVRLIDNMILYQ